MNLNKNARFFVYIFHPKTESQDASDEIVPCNSLEQAAAIYNGDKINSILLKRIDVNVQVQEVGQN